MNSSLNRSLRESLNQKPDRIYFTVIKRGNIYHQRMTCVGNIGKPRASVTVSLRTKSAITAKANAEQLKNKLVSTNGALDCFDNARYTLKNLACTLSTPIGIPLGVPFSCPDNTPNNYRYSLQWMPARAIGNLLSASWIFKVKIWLFYIHLMQIFYTVVMHSNSY